jgi:hypothetical protein
VRSSFKASAGRENAAIDGDDQSMTYLGRGEVCLSVNEVTGQPEFLCLHLDLRNQERVSAQETRAVWKRLGLWSTKGQTRPSKRTHGHRKMPCCMEQVPRGTKGPRATQCGQRHYTSPAVSDHNAQSGVEGALLTPLSLLIMTGPSLCSTKSDGRQMHLEKRSGERDGGSYA